MAELLTSLRELGQVGGAKNVAKVTEDMVKTWMLDRRRFSGDRTPGKLRDALKRVELHRLQSPTRCSNVLFC